MSSDLQMKAIKVVNVLKKTSSEFKRETGDQVTCRELLIIDDRMVREEYFSQAQAVLTQIDEMEANIQAFREGSFRQS